MAGEQQTLSDSLKVPMDPESPLAIKERKAAARAVEEHDPEAEREATCKMLDRITEVEQRVLDNKDTLDRTRKHLDALPQILSLLESDSKVAASTPHPSETSQA